MSYKEDIDKLKNFSKLARKVSRGKDVYCEFSKEIWTKEIEPFIKKLIDENNLLRREVLNYV